MEWRYYAQRYHLAIAIGGSLIALATIQSFWTFPVCALWLWAASKTPKPEAHPAIMRAAEEYTPKLFDHLRTEHTHIVGRSGAGKTTLLKHLIAKDLEKDVAIVLIDSQGDVVREVAERIPKKRVQVLDPAVQPPHANIFYAEELMSADFAEYAFSALGADLTTKQRTAFRYAFRLCQQIPNANMDTMRRIFETGAGQYAWHFQYLPEVAQDFLTEQFDGKLFNQTRQEIAWRLSALMENDTFRTMFNAPTSELYVEAQMECNDVLLVNTGKHVIGERAAALFGRIIIAHIAQAIYARADGRERQRAHIYIDEAQEYFDENSPLANILTQARKYEVGITLAHQFLGQIPTNLAQNIAANTAIKMACNVSPDDANTLAKQLHTTQENIMNHERFHWATYQADAMFDTYIARPGDLERLPKISDYRELFPSPPPPPDTPKKPAIEPRSSGGGDSDEWGDW